MAEEENEDFGPPFEVEYLFWTNLNKTTPSKPPLNNFAETLKNNPNFIDCNHIDPHYILNVYYPFTPEDKAKYKEKRNHYYGGIVPLCLNYSIAAGLEVRFVEPECRKSDLLVVAIEAREDKSLPYDPENFKNRRIAVFSCINLIRNNMIEIKVIGARTNYKKGGGSLVKTLCSHGKQHMKGKFYCWLNALPNAVKFYLKVGFTYIGSEGEGKEARGFMLYDMGEAMNNVVRNKVIQRKNSTNLSNFIALGNPHIKAVEKRNVTKEALDDIPDINMLIDAFSKNKNEAQALFLRRRVPIEDGGYYLPNGFFDEIYPRARAILNPLYMLSSSAPPLDMGSQPSPVRGFSREDVQQLPRQRLVPLPPPGLPSMNTLMRRPNPPKNRTLHAKGLPTTYRKTHRQRKYLGLPTFNSLKKLIGRPPRNNTLKSTSYRNTSHHRRYPDYP
jgi:hypothetical protein